MKLLVLRSLVVAPLLITPQSVFAWSSSMQMTGSSFLTACPQPEQSWVSFCDGYVQAAVDSLREGDGVCLPLGTTRSAIVTQAFGVIATSPRLQATNALDAVCDACGKHTPVDDQT